MIPYLNFAKILLLSLNGTNLHTYTSTKTQTFILSGVPFNMITILLYSFWKVNVYVCEHSVAPVFCNLVINLQLGNHGPEHLKWGWLSWERFLHEFPNKEITEINIHIEWSCLSTSMMIRILARNCMWTKCSLGMSKIMLVVYRVVPFCINYCVCVLANELQDVEA
jgi:hypothetical protein